MEDKNKVLLLSKEFENQKSEENIKKTAELVGIEKEIEKENKQTALWDEVLENLKKEKRFHVEENSKLELNLTQLNEKSNVLINGLQKTENEISEMNREISNLENDLRNMENIIMKFFTRKKDKINEITVLTSEHRMINKTNKIILKNVHKSSVEIEEKKIIIENLENEIVRVK